MIFKDNMQVFNIKAYYIETKYLKREGDNLDEYTIEEVFSIIRNQVYIIVITIVICLVISLVLSFYILSPQYQTYTTLMIIKQQNYNMGIEYNDILMSNKLVATYREIVKSKIVSKEVTKKLGLDITYKEWIEKINVTQLEDSEIIKIDVVDEDPVVSSSISNEIAKSFIKQVTYLMKTQNLLVIDEAEIPTKPIKPRPLLNAAIAVLLGIILGIIIIFYRDFIDNTIKTPEDVGRYLELPVLGKIPKSLKEM